MPNYAQYSNNKVQLLREATAGTRQVTAAQGTVWRGPFAMLEDARERKIVEEQVGAFVSAERDYDASLLAKWAQPSTELTSEQVCHILEAGVKTATPTGSNPYVYVYNYPFSGTAVNTIKTYSIEAGNMIVPADTFYGEHGFVEDFEFSGKDGEAWMMQSNWLARQMTQSAFTASVSTPSVTDMRFRMTKLYIDASGGTLGTTQKTGVLMAANIKVKTGLVAIPVGDGQLYFAAHKWATKPEITFSLTLEVEDGSVVAAERTAWRSKTARLIRLLCDEGANNKFQQDWYAKYDSFGAYENSDGNTTMVIDGHAAPSSTDSLFYTATVTNTRSTLP